MVVAAAPIVDTRRREPWFDLHPRLALAVSAVLFVAIFALGPVGLAGASLSSHDLLLTQAQVDLASGTALAIRLHGLTL